MTEDIIIKMNRTTDEHQTTSLLYMHTHICRAIFNEPSNTEQRTTQTRRVSRDTNEQTLISKMRH